MTKCKKTKDCDCLSCDVNNYPTKYQEGFIDNEIKEILEKYQTLVPNFNMKKFNDALTGNTCMMRDGKIITYHCDILHALNCGIENRDLSLDEWD